MPQGCDWPQSAQDGRAPPCPLAPLAPPGGARREAAFSGGCWAIRRLTRLVDSEAYGLHVAAKSALPTPVLLHEGEQEAAA